MIFAVELKLSQGKERSLFSGSVALRTSFFNEVTSNILILYSQLQETVNLKTFDSVLAMYEAGQGQWNTYTNSKQYIIGAENCVM